ncbi:endonuclease V-like [Asparagus officinalis]|uniref:endonuclease V-like n=1 Tax=Asparagus officinalis TaxID=4686 RepID=UPI00098E690A|nr:endonuclease V-like [Asparagus officinalis]
MYMLDTKHQIGAWFQYGWFSSTHSKSIPEHNLYSRGRGSGRLFFFFFAGFGLACHLGVLADLPTIGIGKSLHHVDDLSQSGVRQHLEEGEICGKDLVPLIGKSGQVWGMALRSTSSSSKPIYISIGHRISLDSSVKVVRSCCKFRLPEPIRLADIRSRVFLQKMQD